MSELEKMGNTLMETALNFTHQYLKIRIQNGERYVTSGRASQNGKTRIQRKSAGCAGLVERIMQIKRIT